MATNRNTRNGNTGNANGNNAPATPAVVLPTSGLCYRTAASATPAIASTPTAQALRALLVRHIQACLAAGLHSTCAIYNVLAGRATAPLVPVVGNMPGVTPWRNMGNSVALRAFISAHMQAVPVQVHTNGRTVIGTPIQPQTRNTRTPAASGFALP